MKTEMNYIQLRVALENVDAELHEVPHYVEGISPETMKEVIELKYKAKKVDQLVKANIRENHKQQ